MMEKIQRKFALSPQGAKDLIKSIICCTLQNIVLMFPVCLLYLLVQDLMNGNSNYVVIDSAPAKCITEAINKMQ